MKITNTKPVPITTVFAQSSNPITDERLFELCRKYGSSALLWRQKFTGLLPEVNRRRLFEKKGFFTIYDFAAKLCGLSVEQVNITLNLRERFEDKPTLRKMLEDGEVSINKLARIVSIATPENEEELAEKVRILPKSALETLIRDEKFAMKNSPNDGRGNTVNLFGENTNQNGLLKPLFGGKSLPGQTLGIAKHSLVFNSGSCTNSGVPSFQLADDVRKELEELNSKGIDVNEFLRKALNQRKEEIEKKKEEIVKEMQPTSSRYVPVEVKKILHEEFGTKCSIPTCQKPAEVIHHTQTFGLSHTHDPRFMAPLCREHHAIAHSMDVKYHKIRRNMCSA